MLARFRISEEEAFDIIKYGRAMMTVPDIIYIRRVLIEKTYLSQKLLKLCRIPIKL